MAGKDERSKDKRKKMKEERLNKKIKHTFKASLKNIEDIDNASVDNWKPNELLKQKNCDLLDDPHYAFNPPEEPEVAADFDILTETSATHFEGHFLFGKEKNWQKAVKEPLSEHSISGHYFRINPKFITTALSTITFLKRMQYPAEIFTCKQLEEMEESAKLAEKNHHIALAHIQLEKAQPMLKITENSLRQFESETNKKSTNPEDFDDELEEILNMCSASSNEVAEQHVEEAISSSALSTEQVNFETIETEILSIYAHSTCKEDDSDWLDSVLGK